MGQIKMIQTKKILDIELDNRHILKSSGKIVSENFKIDGKTVISEKYTLKLSEGKTGYPSYNYYLLDQPKHIFRSLPELERHYKTFDINSEPKGFENIIKKCQVGSIVAYKMEDWKLAKIQSINKNRKTILIKFYTHKDIGYFYDRQKLDNNLINNFENFVVLEY